MTKPGNVDFNDEELRFWRHDYDASWVMRVAGCDFDGLFQLKESGPYAVAISERIDAAFRAFRGL